MIHHRYSTITGYFSLEIIEQKLSQNLIQPILKLYEYVFYMKFTEFKTIN